jgi:opacity protein-like surface antigen
MSLNKIATLAIFTMLSFFPLQAQWEVGGLIGLNISNLSVNPGSSSEDYSSRLGLGIGVVVDKPLSDQIHLHAEPMFLQKGSSLETSDFTAVFKLSYIELPIMFKYVFQTSASVIPYAMAGPSIGLLTSSKVDFEDGGEQDEKDNTNIFDFGLGFGGGISLPHENLTFFAETRYVFGLTNVNKESDESTVKNRGLQVIIGVTFPVGSK